MTGRTHMPPFLGTMIKSDAKHVAALWLWFLRPCVFVRLLSWIRNTLHLGAPTQARNRKEFVVAPWVNQLQSLSMEPCSYTSPSNLQSRTEGYSYFALVSC